MNKTYTYPLLGFGFTKALSQKLNLKDGKIDWPLCLHCQVTFVAE